MKRIAFTLAENATHVAHWDNSRKIAFTLAEVLITLGIIGVVSAITIPTLMANHRKKVVETKLEKIYSVMNQAINLTNAEYGDVTNWIIDCGSSNSPTCSMKIGLILLLANILKH